MNGGSLLGRCHVGYGLMETDSYILLAGVVRAWSTVVLRIVRSTTARAAMGLVYTQHVDPEPLMAFYTDSLLKNKKPSGLDTSSLDRPKNGKVPFGGAGVYDCVNANDIALTFDDGPYIYTNDLLDKLKV